MPKNIELKARCENLDRVKSTLLLQGACYPLGPKFIPGFFQEDNQVDTYFNARHGRLKLREGKIEAALIHYNRIDSYNHKPSEIILLDLMSEALSRVAILKEILTASIGFKIRVEKQRLIGYIGNVKFHLDRVPQLGTFVEIEAIDALGDIGTKKLQEQCTYYQHLLGIKDEQIVNCSYSDMFLIT